MAKKYYVVWAGHEPGIYQDWPTAQRQVSKFPGAQYKSFTNKLEAEAAFKSGGNQSPSSTSKPAQKSYTKSSSKKSTADSSQSANGYDGKTGVNPNMDITIFCDGGCEPNPGKAGSGIAVYRRDKLVQLWYGKYNSNGTNNTAELNALYQSLSLAKIALDKEFSVEVRCDSMYSIQCIRDWAPGWEKRGWKKKDGEIKNLDIIKLAYGVFQDIKANLVLSHVKAHAGTEGNEMADRMTMVAVDKKDAEWCKYPASEAGEFDIAALLKMRAG